MSTSDQGPLLQRQVCGIAPIAACAKRRIELQLVLDAVDLPLHLRHSESNCNTHTTNHRHLSPPVGDTSNRTKCDRCDCGIHRNRSNCKHNAPGGLSAAGILRRVRRARLQSAARTQRQRAVHLRATQRPVHPAHGAWPARRAHWHYHGGGQLPWSRITQQPHGGSTAWPVQSVSFI